MKLLRYEERSGEGREREKERYTNRSYLRNVIL